MGTGRASVREQVLFDFDAQELLELGVERAPAYASAAPFPHMVFDDFLPESLCDAVLDEWPSFESIEWTTYDNPQELKHVCSDLGRLGPVTGGLLNAFNGSSFVRFVQVLSASSAWAVATARIGRAASAAAAARCKTASVL